MLDQDAPSTVPTGDVDDALPMFDLATFLADGVCLSARSQIDCVNVARCLRETGCIVVSVSNSSVWYIQASLCMGMGWPTMALYLTFPHSVHPEALHHAASSCPDTRPSSEWA